MERRPKLVDVARVAGVHLSTASRALNQGTRHLISDEVVARVVRTAEELRYRPNFLASGLRSQRSGMIGVIVDRLDDPIFPTIVRAVEGRIRQDYVTFVGDADNEGSRRSTLLRRMIDRGVDGILVSTFRIKDPLVRTCLESGTPTVAILRDPLDRRISSVVFDDVAAGEAAARHLVELGHRRVGHVAGPQNISTGRDRRQGFIDAVAQAAAPVEASEVTAGVYTIEEGRRCCAEMLARHPGVTGIVAANDVLAVGCLIELAERGIACPAAMSVVGINDMQFMSCLSPPLTTVRNLAHDLGREGADLLLKLIADPRLPARCVTLSPELIVRASAGPPRVDAPTGRQRALAE